MPIVSVINYSGNKKVLNETLDYIYYPDYSKEYNLNEKLETPLPMNRFRPNLVFTGGFPHQEDELKVFSINKAELLGVKPCARCGITTTNQATAEVGIEPLKTLVSYRRINRKILFGQNVIPQNVGEVLEVGEELKIKNG